VHCPVSPLLRARGGVLVVLKALAIARPCVCVSCLWCLCLIWCLVGWGVLVQAAQQPFFGQYAAPAYGMAMGGYGGY
jgi:hypothetical protein